MLQPKMPVATHEISLHGLSGAIFWLILSAVVFYVLGFATVGWERFRTVYGSGWVGLWQICASSDHHTYGDQGMPSGFTTKHVLFWQ